MELNLTSSGYKIFHARTSQAAGLPILLPIPEKGGLILTAADFDITAMRLAVGEFDAEKAGKELDITDLDPGNIEMDLKLWPCKESFLNMVKNVMRADNDPLYYVIRPDHLAGWFPPNAFEQLMCQLSHSGAVYNGDKKMV